MLKRWFGLTHWENYCLLAIAGVAVFLLVAVRVESRRNAHRMAMAMRHGELISQPRAEARGWLARHRAIVAKAHDEPYDVMLLGDSITRGWELHGRLWDAAFPGRRALNAGIDSDRIENVLWRVQHGLFAKRHPREVILMAGINNLDDTEPSVIADGLGQVIRAIQARSPGTHIIVLGLFPSGADPEHPRRARIVKTNRAIAARAHLDHAEFLDIGSHFLSANGQLQRAVSTDALHLTSRGYKIWAQAMAPRLVQN